MFTVQRCRRKCLLLGVAEDTYVNQKFYYNTKLSLINDLVWANGQRVVHSVLLYLQMIWRWFSICVIYCLDVNCCKSLYMCACEYMCAHALWGRGGDKEQSFMTSCINDSNRIYLVFFFFCLFFVFFLLVLVKYSFMFSVLERDQTYSYSLLLHPFTRVCVCVCFIHFDFVYPASNDDDKNCYWTHYHERVKSECYTTFCRGH